MGAWGPHSFENDAAMDWVARFQADGPEEMWAALEAVARGDGRPEADAASIAIAAAEGVALAAGARSTEATGPDLVAMFRMASDDVLAEYELIGLALFTVAMLRDGASEVSELWDDADGTAWRAAVDDLATRLMVIADRHGFAAPQSIGPLPVRKARSVHKPGKRTPEQIQLDALEDIRTAIGGLRFDLEMVRMDIQDGFAALQRDLSGGNEGK